jgi:hypothetical protein
VQPRVAYATYDACAWAKRKLAGNQKNYSCKATATIDPAGPLPPLAEGLMWATLAVEGGAYASSTYVYYGAGSLWTVKLGPGLCTNAFFDFDPVPGTVKSCKAQVPVPPPPNVPPTPIDHHAGLPVDISGIVLQSGASVPMLSDPTPLAPLPAAGDWEADGKFRTVCNTSAISFDDPIVYPGQPGMAHLHNVFGNTAFSASLTPANIRSKGNSSCRGGTINMTAYWTPAMVDTAAGKPVLPKSNLVYYYTNFWPYMDDGSQMMPIPHGLVMIAGDAKLTGPGNPGNFSCLIKALGYNRTGFDRLPTIPVCVTGEDELWMTVNFPQCWIGNGPDGKPILDSPDHRSHMAYPEANPLPHTVGREYRCPLDASGRYSAGQLSRHVRDPGERCGDEELAAVLGRVRRPAGYSVHGDWMYGWDTDIADAWMLACIRARRNCGTAQLADGRTTLEFQGN